MTANTVRVRPSEARAARRGFCPVPIVVVLQPFGMSSPGLRILRFMPHHPCNKCMRAFDRKGAQRSLVWLLRVDRKAGQISFERRS